MMYRLKLLLGILFFMTLIHNVHAQNRIIDAATKLTYPANGYTYKSISVDSVSYTLYNNGPDTIVPSDYYFSEVKFAGNVFYTQKQVKRYMYPGDSIKLKYAWTLKYILPLDNVDLCVNSRFTSYDTINIGNREKNGMELDNKTCIKVNHRKDSTQVGITDKELAISNFVSAYPNPTTGLVHIDAQVLLNEITILDQLGRVCQAESINETRATTLTLNATLPNGLYTVLMRDVKGTTYYLRIVKY
jgi:hypothetical protein